VRTVGLRFKIRTLDLPKCQSLNSNVYSHPKMRNKGKGKVLPLQARCGPEGSRRFRLPDFHDIRHMVVRSSASRTGRLYPQECSWYSFSLGAESTPRPRCGRKEICHWKIQWHHRYSIPGPSDLVAQRLNHYAIPGPFKMRNKLYKRMEKQLKIVPETPMRLFNIQRIVNYRHVFKAKRNPLSSPRATCCYSCYGVHPHKSEGLIASAT
jgi:hypothetical protein